MGKLQRPARLRVAERDPVRPQSERPGRGRAVFRVAAQRQPAGRELRADLVRAPGLQPDEDERAAVFLAQHAVGKPRRTRIRPGRVGDAGAPGGGVAAQLVLQYAGCLGRTPSSTAR